MAPTWGTGDAEPTYVSLTVGNFSGYYYTRVQTDTRKTKSYESKKAKRDRISKELMIASQKIFNQKTDAILKIKKVSPPVARLKHLRR